MFRDSCLHNIFPALNREYNNCIFQQTNVSDSLAVTNKKPEMLVYLKKQINYI